jgi:hypothetical protein
VTPGARALGVLLVCALTGLAPATGAAHPASVAQARIEVEERAVRMRLSMNLLELDLVLSLDANLDGRVDAGELEARRVEVREYLRGKVGVSTGSHDLPLDLETLGIGQSGDGRPVVVAALAFRSARALGDLAIRCEPLTELGTDHTTLARIETAGISREFAFRAGVTYRDAPGALARGLAFLRLGVVHIIVGYDHVAFLLLLLLAGGSTLAIIKIVTAFTAAHSVTLSLAALDMVAVSPALVEAGIALSIVYVAAENLFAPVRSGRWLVSFLFGLVHGFGFAAVLRELALPRAALVTSLVTFNLGVEVAQVAIVALVVPLLSALARTRLHAPFTRMASAVIGSLGLVWLYQRVLS